MKIQGFVEVGFTRGRGFQLVQYGPLGTIVRMHHRPNYTVDEAADVANWLNGQDQPLPTIKRRESDENDPRARWNRRTVWNFPRKGLAPISD